MLCGCSRIGVNKNITGLLSSPKHSQTESLIVQEIGDYLGENITLKYSQTQGYSAPIQFADIDGDKTDEALVFYYAPNKGTNIRFAFLKNIDEKWEIVFDKEGLGTEVFYFDTIELQGLAGKQILVGYLSSNINENFFVTYFTDTQMGNEDYMEVCEDIFIAVFGVRQKLAACKTAGPAVFIVGPCVHAKRLRLLAAFFNAVQPFFGKVSGLQTASCVHEETADTAVVHPADLFFQFFGIELVVPGPKGERLVIGANAGKCFFDLFHNCLQK